MKPKTYNLNTIEGIMEMQKDYGTSGELADGGGVWYTRMIWCFPLMLTYPTDASNPKIEVADTAPLFQETIIGGN